MDQILGIKTCDPTQCPYYQLSRTSRFGIEIACLTEEPLCKDDRLKDAITLCCAQSTAHYIRASIAIPQHTTANLNINAIKATPPLLVPYKTTGMQAAIGVAEALTECENPNLIDPNNIPGTVLRFNLRDIILRQTGGIVSRGNELSSLLVLLKLANPALSC